MERTGDGELEAIVKCMYFTVGILQLSPLSDDILWQGYNFNLKFLLRRSSCIDISEACIISICSTSILATSACTTDTTDLGFIYF